MHSATASSASPGPFDPDRPDHDPGVARALLVVGRTAAWLAVLLGVTVLVGYVARSRAIVQLAPSLPPMYPNAALAFVIGGLGVRLASSVSPSQRRGATAAGGALAILSLATLVLHALAVGPTWMEGLWPDDPFVAATTPYPGRPAPETCVAMLGAGLAVVLSGRRVHPLVVQGLALGTTTVGVAAALGYAIGVDRVRLGSSFVAVGMALHTAIGVAMLGVAILLSRPLEGILGLLASAGPAGRIARRLVAVALAAPVALAAATAALERALPDARLALSVATVLQVGVLGALVMIPAVGIIQFDRMAAAATREARRQRETTSERDTLVASLTAQLVLPTASLAGWRLAATQEPAFGELAGDSLLVLERDDHVLVAVVDVAGHGTEPALQAFRLRIELASLWRQGLELRDVVGHLDRSVVELGTIATGVFVSIERQTGALSAVTAGHPPAMLVHAAGSVLLERTGPVLGLDSDHGVVDAHLDHGDLLVIYTDGVSEARDARGDLLGDEAVHQLVRRWAPLGPDAVVAACTDAARTHAGERLGDDAMVVALQRV